MTTHHRTRRSSTKPLFRGPAHRQNFLAGCSQCCWPSFVIDNHWASYVRPSGLPREVQNTVEDLPFVGTELFLLHSLQDSKATLGSFGIYIPGTKRFFSKSETAQHSWPFHYHPYHTYSRLANPPWRRSRSQKKRLHPWLLFLCFPPAENFDKLVEGHEQISFNMLHGPSIHLRFRDPHPTF